MMMLKYCLTTGWNKTLSWLTLLAYAGLLCLSVLHFHPDSHHGDEHGCQDETAYSAPHHSCGGETSAACSICQILKSAPHYILSDAPVFFQQQDIHSVAYSKQTAFSQTVSFKNVRAPPVFVA